MKANRDDSLQKYAAKAVLKRTRSLARQIRSARQRTEVETVHDLRVASRRLSTTLTLFESQFPRRRIRSWGKRLRRLRRALGKARDLDVQEAFLRDFLRQSHEFLGGLAEVELRPGIERLAARVRGWRSERRRKVPKAVRRFEKRDVLPELKRAAKDLQTACHSSKADGHAVRSRAQAAILEHLEDLLALEPCLGQPGAAAEHHAMRIAAKHLRYALEVFLPLYGARAARFIATARQCQDRLGEIRDCDVWVEFLPQFLDAEKARPGADTSDASIAPGILFLQDDRRRWRQRLFKDFVVFWQKLRRDHLWEALVDFVRVPPAVDRRPATSHRTSEAA
jgi:CHAD domain-containing protein